MPIPAFLSPKPMGSAATEARASTLGGQSGIVRKQIAISVEPQEQDNWCWSAVGVSVERFYEPTATRTQCQLAGTALQRADCCGDGADDPGKCDRPWYLDLALAITGNLEEMTSESLSFADIQARVGAGSPVGCRIGWYGGSGHFALIKGWLVGADGEQYVDVSDPIFLESQIALGAFPSSYQSGGDWTHSYLTTPASALGGATLASAPRDPGTIGA